MGRYEGELTVTWKPDGRLMELQDTFAFIDKDELKWDVPAGAQIDGASIPQVLWSITGSPYTGKYRDASVIHDWYCSVRTRTSDATHSMFHEAMLVSGVSTVRARVMYAAVRYAGPKWTQMDIHNTRLASGKRSGGGKANYWGPGGMPPFDTPEYNEHMAQKMEQETNKAEAKEGDAVEVLVRADTSEAEFKRIADEVIAQDLDVNAIDLLVSSLDTSKTRRLESGLYGFSKDIPLP